MDVILRDVILGLTALSSGAVLWLAVGNIRAAVRYRDPAPAFYALARIGFVTVVLTIAELVADQRGIPFNVRTVLYTSGLLMAAIGYAGVLVFEHRRNDHGNVDRKAR